MAVTLNKAAVAFAQSKIDAGDYTKSSWSWDAAARQALFDAEGRDWAKFARWFLGIDSAAADETFGRYKYPVGKSGKVYSRALANAAARASAQNLSDVSSAASDLVEYINDKEEGTGESGDEGTNEPAGRSMIEWQRRMEEVFSRAVVQSVKAESQGDGVFTAIATTDQVDRQHERVIPAGIVNLKDYLRDNPVVLYAHNWMGLPIGRAVAGRVVGNTLEIDIEFAQTEMGKEIRYLYENKFLNAFSIGFLPVEMEDKSDVPTYSKWELLELSSVPIPANAGALAVRRAQKEGRELAIVKSLIAAPATTPARQSEMGEVRGLRRIGLGIADSVLRRKET